jgi:hypothetical protein
MDEDKYNATAKGSRCGLEKWQSPTRFRTAVRFGIYEVAIRSG